MSIAPSTSASAYHNLAGIITANALVHRRPVLNSLDESVFLAMRCEIRLNILLKSSTYLFTVFAALIFANGLRQRTDDLMLHSGFR